MMLAKLRIAAAVLLMPGVVGAGGLLAYHARQTTPVNEDVQKVLDKHRAARPDDRDLAIFQLDWTPTLKDARAKAAREQRPIFLIVVTNSFGDIHGGHC